MNIECCEKGSKTQYDIADIFKHSGQQFLESCGASHEQIKVMNRIITCRTAALGGHLEDICFHPQDTHEQLLLIHIFTNYQF